MIRSPFRACLKQALLWIGLLLCGYALWSAQAFAGDAIGGFSLFGWAILGVLLLSIWTFSVVAWRRYLLAYVGRDPGWRVAMRQLGLLLVGKYVPGGIFGFLARMYDQPSESRSKLFWAGLTEQAVGVGMNAALGGVVLIAALGQSLAWLNLVLCLPVAAIGGIWLLHQCASRLPWLRKRAELTEISRWRVLFSAVVLHLLQCLAWSALIVLVAIEFYGLSSFAAIGVAGAFLLSVVAGMLVVVAPGGIGVREVVLIGLASCWLDMPQAVFLAALLRIVASFLDVVAGGIAAVVSMQGAER